MAKIAPRETSSTGIEYGGDNFHSTEEVNKNITDKFNHGDFKELEPGKAFGDLFDPSTGNIYTYEGEPGKGRWNIAGENHSGLDVTDPAFDDQTTWHDSDQYDKDNGIL